MWPAPSLVMLLVLAPGLSRAGETMWNFSNPADRLAASTGTGTLEFFDPAASGWGAAQTSFGKASSFGLPPMPGGDADVMSFPACSPEQGFVLRPNASGNGPYGETNGLISNYTLVMDVLFPSASDGLWRGLWQTDPINASDAEFYVRNQASGGIGISGNYLGRITPDRWHRIAFVVRAAPGEGYCQRFIDGQFVGGIGTSGSGLDIRWALGTDALLFTDDDGETAAGFVSSIYLVDRALTMESIRQLGGPRAGGANVAGDPPAPLPQQMPRRVRPIGHRGGAMCCAPDNTLAAVQAAIDAGLEVIEIDTRLSADDVCVLIHDSTVDRTTDGTGDVSAMTVAQLKSLDAGSWFDVSFSGERIPTAAEAMALAKGKLVLFFDLKTNGQVAAIQSAAQATGFDLDDVWFWVSHDAAEAQAIRAAVPAAKIIWGDPDAGWMNDPSYFGTLRGLGVYGFDLASGYGTANAAFTAAAKSEGFIVACYTILDAEAMVRNAAAGVDFMETDYPQIMNSIQPPQQAKASAPFPADGATDVPADVTCFWVVGQGATAHRVRFGATSPPPLIGDQSFDLLVLDDLLPGTTYHWQIDELMNGVAVPGDTWRFTVSETQSAPHIYEWRFDAADLGAALGSGEMSFANAATEDATVFAMTDGILVPHIGGVPAGYMHVPAFTDPADGYLLDFVESGPNGGGGYINQFTIIMDVLIPSPFDWTPFFQTNPGNPAGNDADFYMTVDGSIGIGELGYSASGVVRPLEWHRIAFAADLGNGLANIFVDGTHVHQRAGGSLLDGRFSLFSNADPGPDVLLFNEGDTSGVYTHELLLSSVAVVDAMMTESEIAALGGPQAPGIFITAPLPEIDPSILGSNILLEWTATPGVRLQRSPTFAAGSWQDVPGTQGAGSWTEPVVENGSRFFRLTR